MCHPKMKCAIVELHNVAYVELGNKNKDKVSQNATSFIGC